MKKYLQKNKISEKKKEISKINEIKKFSAFKNIRTQSMAVSDNVSVKQC